MLKITLLALSSMICLISADDDSKPTSKTSHRNVPVYTNSKGVFESSGRHYSASGYYFGQKWQCVEYVKRFYYKAFNHKMPSVWGHAKDFYDSSVSHGGMNKTRGMLQYKNGGKTAPKPDDLIVSGMAPYGHVAIITKVDENKITVIQQNISGMPTQTLSLKKENGTYQVSGFSKIRGWLRLPKNKRKPVEIESR